jgi:hypothetical protein
LTLDHLAVMPLFASPILPVDPAVKAKSVAILVAFFAALAQLRRFKPDVIDHE